MSGRLPVCTGMDVLRALKRAGFQVHHIKGSHHSLRHPERPEIRMVIPVHRKELPTGTLRSIIKQCQLSEGEFIGLL